MIASAANSACPLWRSMLFIPADNQKFIDRVHERGADACVLDLEDSIPLERKAAARAAVPQAARDIRSRGTDVLVRVNSETLAEDIAAVVRSDIRAIVLPKVNSAEAVLAADKLILRAEAQQAISAGTIRLILQIEDVAALPHLDEIARASARTLGMSLGSEDFSASAGMQPTARTLYWPNLQVVFACRRAGISPFGFPLSIGIFDDADALNEAVAAACEMGFIGAFCIHPAQVPILNSQFTPEPGDVSDALEIVQGYEQAMREGRGAFAFKGKMIDPPVVARARELIDRYHAIALRQPQAL